MIKNRMKTDPIPVVRQSRTVAVRNLTSAPPGRVVPIAAFGLLRGDGCSGRLNVGVQMAETFEVLFNRQTVRLSLVFVPKVALDRFQRNKTFFERSGVGEPITDEVGAPVIPFQETEAFAINPLYKHLGLVETAGRQVTTDYKESYNVWVNYAKRQRSKSLAQRLKGDTTLAPALWGPNSISEIVPTFDLGMIAGNTPLTVVQAQMPVKGLGFGTAATGFAGPVNVRETGDTSDSSKFASGYRGAHTSGSLLVEATSAAANAAPKIYAQLAQNGITVSLANFDQARKLVEWAQMREQYEGHSDPFIIDTLMQGLPIDDQMWFQPMLIDTQTLSFEQIKRMATDGANLENGVANGTVATSLGCNIPSNPYGGVVMVLAEAIPEQLFERQADPYFQAATLNELPRYDRDMLNPMPVVEVKNKQVDTLHNVPEGRFGYARRNWQWDNNPARVGGDFYAPNNDAPTTVDRQVIYPTEVSNPALNTEFYESTTLGLGPFVGKSRNPFRFGVGGKIDVVGLTVIGEVHESEANYDAVRADYGPLVPPAGV